jgi:molecular chaperone DnaJ
MKDYYEILGVPKTATQDDISKAYRSMARQYHPDRAKDDPEATAKFKAATEAYEFLGDEEKRKRYDRGGAAEPQQGFGGFSHEDIFGRFFEEEESVDMQMNVPLDFMEAAKGCTKEIQMPTKKPCEKCKASGVKSKTDCSRCNGTGKISVKQASWVIGMGCPNCKGNGFTNIEWCDCKEGFIETGVEDVKIRFPAGVDRGNVLKVKGKGEYSPKGTRGDLYVRVFVNPHEFFERDGLNLHCKIPVTYTQLAMGSEVSIPGLNASISAKLPAGTQNGAKLKMRGQGIVAKGHTGDMIVTVFAPVPKNIPEEYTQKLQELAELEAKYPSEEITAFKARM